MTNTSEWGRSALHTNYLKYFFNSNLVKFIFLITQYASGMRTVNEVIVANNITIPSSVEDIYDYYGITKEEKELIESIVSGDISRVDGSDTPPIKPKRCQKGSRKNKKTGDCESVSPIKGKGVRKNRRTRRKIT